MAKTRLSSSFVRSITFTLCLALSLTGLPLPASTQSQTPLPGVRTQGPPSPNLPNIEAVRNAPEPKITKPEPVRASRCRHWDKKCKDLKEKKTSLLFPPESDQSRAMLAAVQSPASDWLSQTLPFTSPLNLFNAASRPVADLPIGRRVNATGKPRTLEAVRTQPMPHAFASSLLPMTALQAANFETARVEPRYRTGQPGEDLLSGNYNWSLPIVSLPGRAGHDLNLSLVYNSVVWTKAGTQIRFDQDYGWPSPGFRFGFPVFYGPYLNTTTNRWAYVVITPAGEAVEMVKVSGQYETYDAENSSYLRLKFDTTLAAWVLTAANGTQFIYGQTLQIKDRNGNRITATYDANGLMDTITDTLGRQILLEYGEYFELLKVKQYRNGAMTTLAQFDYANIQLFFNFGSLYVDNVTYGQTIPVIYQVTLLDNTRYKFDWSSYGQVNKITGYGGLTFQRNWTSYNFPTHPTGGQQSDSPQFTTRTDWAYDWSTSSGVNTQFLFNQSATNPDAATETTAPTLTYGQVTVPDGTVHKAYYYPSPASTNKWRYGLMKMSDTVSAGILRKRAKTNWEQPCGGGSIGNWIYQCNPRPTETNTYDNTDADPNTWENRRRTTFAYAQPGATDFNLVADVYEYDSNATTVLRRTHTDYNQTSTYINRRIIGLPTASFLYDGGNALHSRVEYLYDESGYLQATSATPTQHDSTNYGIGFLAGRANQTTVRRYDVTNQTYVEWKTGYNITGSPTFSRDPRYSATNAQTTISYTDAWVNVYGSNLPNLNTFAYPTMVTDMDGYSSTMKYDFDLGAMRFVTDPKGAVTMSEFDGVGRRWKTTSGYGSASPFYTSLNFDSLGNWVKSYSSIESGQPDFYSITTFDGHGRVRATVSDHPGSSGQYRGVYRGYDTMGRQTQASNPTEINTSWIPTGDDSAGWDWSFQSYDWQGRPLVSTNQDGTTKIASYTGCGCAGGQVVTVQDEGDGVLVNGQPRRRQQKITYDTLGRVAKTQVLNWDATIYSTTLNSYNVRDQVTSLKQYQGTETADGSCPSATCQEAWTNYDGYGRVKQQKRPVESGPSTFTYNSDDTTASLTDARGVVSNFTYNNRRLVTGVTYDIPANSGVAPTSNVTFGYDEQGNRSWMVETSTPNYAGGRVDYVYNSLSQLQSETRHFNTPNRDYTISYGYNLAGQLTSLASPFNHTVSFSRDKNGRLSGVSDTTSSGATTSYSSQIKYRAWDAVKSLNYGNGLTQTATHNARQQITGFTITGRNPQYGAPDIMKAAYQYHPDGQPKFAEDQLNANFTRGWSYDHLGRLNASYTGSEATSWLNNQPPSGTPTGPYKQLFTYNVWNEMTNREARFWSKTDTLTAQFTDARRQGWTYDNAGNIITDGQSAYTYDAAGRNTRVEGSNLSHATQSHDGDGNVIKRIESDPTGPKPWHRVYFTSHYLRSTALGGQVLAKLDQNGDPGSEDFGIGGAEEVRRYNDGTVHWVHQAPMTGSKGESRNNTLYFGTEELNSDGVDVGFSEPETFPNDYDLDVPSYTGGGAGGDPNAPQCYIDGIPDDGCRYTLRLVSLGFASVDPRRTDSWAAGRLGLRPVYGLVQGKDLKSGDPRLPPVDLNSTVVHSGSENNHWELIGYRSDVIGVGIRRTGGPKVTEQEYVDSVEISQQNPKTPNEWLADCYKQAVGIYEEVKSNQEKGWDGFVIKTAEALSPTTIGGALTFGVGAKMSYDAAKEARYVYFIKNIQLAGGPQPSGIGAAIRGGAKNALNIGAKGILGAAAVGLTIGGAVVQGLDAYTGADAFLREAINDCNKGNPNAIGRIWVSGWKQALGISPVGDIKDYIRTNKR